MEFMMERHLPVQAPNIYTLSAVGNMVETNELSLFFQGLRDFPSHLYVRKEDTIVHELFMTRAMSQSVRRVGVVGGAGVGKSTLLISICLSLWQHHNKNVVIVRFMREEDEDRYAVITLKAGKQARVCKTGEWWVVLAILTQEQHSSTLVADGYNRLDICGYSAMQAFSFYSMSDFDCSRVQAGDELFLVPAWHFFDLRNINNHLINRGEAELHYYLSGGNLAAFLTEPTLLGTSLLGLAGRLSDRDLTGTSPLISGSILQTNPLYRVYNIAPNDPTSYNDRSRWRLVQDVGYVLVRYVPKISLLVYAEALATALHLNSGTANSIAEPQLLNPLLWAHNALLGYMHRLAYQGRLVIEAVEYWSQKVINPGTRYGLCYSMATWQKKPLWVRSGMGRVSCLQQLSQEYRSEEVSYWLPEEWEDSPIDAVLYCGGMCCALMLKATLTAEVDIDAADLKAVHDALLSSLPTDWIVQLVLVQPVEVARGLATGNLLLTARELRDRSGIPGIATFFGLLRVAEAHKDCEDTDPAL
jgi:hypothetical protein